MVALVAVIGFFICAARLVEIGNPLGIEVLPQAPETVLHTGWFFLIFWSNVVRCTSFRLGDTSEIRPSCGSIAP